MKDESDEHDIGRLLRAAGHREHLPEALKQRWEQGFREQLQARASRRQRRRRSLATALAAGVAALAVALYLARDAAAPAPALVRVVTVSGELTGSDGRRLAPGTDLQPGERLATGPAGRAALSWAGYDLRLNLDTRLELREAGVLLRSGEIYVSDTAGGIKRRRLTVHTAHGAIRDIGTQFAVVVDSRATVARVRRGVIELSTAGSTHRAAASAGLAGQLTVNRHQRVSSASAPASGDSWRWIYAADPGFALEGRSALDFLSWSAGESGLELVFTSPAARRHAAQAILHGSLAGLDPEQAVAPVLAATDLVAVAGDGELRVGMRQ